MDFRIIISYGDFVISGEGCKLPGARAAAARPARARPARRAVRARRPPRRAPPPSTRRPTTRTASVKQILLLQHSAALSSDTQHAMFRKIENIVS